MTSLEKLKWKLIAAVLVALVAGGLLWYYEYYKTAFIVELIFALLMFCGYILESAVGKEDPNEW